MEYREEVPLFLPNAVLRAMALAREQDLARWEVCARDGRQAYSTINFFSMHQLRSLALLLIKVDITASTSEGGTLSAGEGGEAEIDYRQLFTVQSLDLSDKSSPAVVAVMNVIVAMARRINPDLTDSDSQAYGDQFLQGMLFHQPILPLFHPIHDLMLQQL